MLDDDIDCFYEHDPTEGLRRPVHHDTACIRSFGFMQQVMRESKFPATEEEIDSRFNKLGPLWDEIMQPLMMKTLDKDVESFGMPAFSYLMKLFSDTVVKKESAKDPSHLLNVLESYQLKAEGKIVEDALSKGDMVGQVALWNQDSTAQTAYFDRLAKGDTKSTHLVSSVRYQVVLFNLNSVRHIHPVTDDVLFDEPIYGEVRKQLQIVSDPNKAKHGYCLSSATLAAMQGYRSEDKVLVYLLALNKISGFMVYWFGFRCGGGDSIQDQSGKYKKLTPLRGNTGVTTAAVSTPRSSEDVSRSPFDMENEKYSKVQYVDTQSICSYFAQLDQDQATRNSLNDIGSLHFLDLPVLMRPCNAGIDEKQLKLDLDKRLADLNLIEKVVKRDGSCQFHSLADQLTKFMAPPPATVICEPKQSIG